MPNPIYAKFDGIDGSCTVDGREKFVTVLQMDHTVEVPVDVKDASATGTRRHGAISLICNVDAATPQMFEAVCRSKVIPKVEIKFYQMDGTSEVNYFNVNLETVRVVKASPWFPNVDDAPTTNYKHMITYDLRYDVIEWVYTDGNKSFKDEWKKPNG